MKSHTVALILAILLPGFDRIYLGYIGLGIGKLICMFIPLVNLIWWIIDIVKIVKGEMKAADGSELQK